MDPNNRNSSPPRSDATPASSPAADQSRPIPVPDHELLRPIGKGSYGTVWLARHVIGVYRAVKIVFRDSFSNSKPFERELAGIKRFEPISRSHEGFVDVLHVGIHGEDCFYYVMELGDAEGTGQTFDPASYSPRTLNKEISLHGKLPFQQCLELAIALSDALVALHKQRLAHRDIKPANIIFVNGIPKLADIGLVAGVDEKHSYVGTQGFIPPEGAGTPQADIYSLGKVLYEASTGKDRQDFPDLPTELESLTDQEGFLELNEVILQACRNDLTKRYQTAWDMHSDLLIIAKGKSVKRLKLLEKRFAYAKRIGTIFALTLLLIFGIAYILYAHKQASAARQQQLVLAVAEGNHDLESGRASASLTSFAEALRLDGDNPDHRSAHCLQFSSALAQCPKPIQFWSLGTELRDGEFSPDGKKTLLSQFSGAATLFDIETGRPYPHVFSAKSRLGSGVFNADGKKILLASEDNAVYLCDTTEPYSSLRIPHPCHVMYAKFDSLGRKFATAGTDAIVRIWNTQAGTNQTPLSLIGHTAVVRYAAFSHNGRYIITCSWDGTAILWDAINAKPLRTLEHDNNWVYYASFSPDDSKIVTACGDYKARLWDTKTGQRILVDMDHAAPVICAEFSPDGRLIVTASLDNTAHIWRADSGQPLFSNLVLQHGSGVTHACFSPDGSRILTTCADGTACVWDLAGCLAPPTPVQKSFSGAGNRFLTVTNQIMQIFETASGKELSRLPVPAEMSFKDFALNANGRFVVGILSCKTNSQIQVWDALTCQKNGSAILVANSNFRTTLSDGGARLATFGSDKAQVWDTLSGKPLTAVLEHPGKINLALFSPDGGVLAIACANTVYAWNSLSGKPAFAPLTHPKQVQRAAFSPNGKYFATCCADNLITRFYAQVWDTATGREIGPKLWHDDGVVYVSFSPDNKKLATAGEDHIAVIWDFVSGKKLTAALKHSAKVLTVMYSPDGKWIVTACMDNSLRVWSADTGEPVTPPLRHIGHLKGALFLNDSRRIAALDFDGSASVWELPLAERPLEDLKEIASLLSGNSSAPSAEAQLALRQKLQGMCPDILKPSASADQSWHEAETWENETEKQWPAAVFHLQQLVAARPGDLLLAKRLATAKAHLDK